MGYTAIPIIKDAAIATLVSDILDMYYAESFTAFSDVAQEISDYYEKNTTHFYEIAHNSPVYNDALFYDRPIQQNIEMHRAFSVIKESYTNKETEKFLISKAQQIIPAMVPYLINAKSPKKFDWNKFFTSMEDVTENYISSGTKQTWEMRRALKVLPLFCAFRKFGKKEIYWQGGGLGLPLYILLETSMARFMEWGDSISPEKKVEICGILEEEVDWVYRGIIPGHDYKDRNVIDKPEQFSRDFMKVYDVLNNGVVLSIIPQLSAVHESVKELNRSIPFEKRVKETTKTCVNGKLMYDTYIKIFERDGSMPECLMSLMNISKGIAYALERGGAPTELNWFDIEISEDEKAIILNYLARKTGIVENRKAAISEYYVAMVCYITAKAIRRDRKYFTEHNLDLLIDKMLRLETINNTQSGKLAEQSTIIEELTTINNSLRKQNKIEQENAVTRGVKSAQAALLEEISMLRKQNERLQSLLEEERKQKSELNALREFAFSAAQKDIEPRVKTSLKDLAQGKKILVIGGHTNWRNHLKDNFPGFSIISGTDNSDFDVKKLSNYDFVFLNTFNMSHSTYYRIIDGLRTGSVPFDYLGRYSNQNLIEQEMAEILMRRYAENRE